MKKIIILFFVIVPFSAYSQSLNNIEVQLGLLNPSKALFGSNFPEKNADISISNAFNINFSYSRDFKKIPFGLAFVFGRSNFFSEMNYNDFSKNNPDREKLPNSIVTQVEYNFIQGSINFYWKKEIGSKFQFQSGLGIGFITQGNNFNYLYRAGIDGPLTTRREFDWGVQNRFNDNALRTLYKNDFHLNIKYKINKNNSIGFNYSRIGTSLFITKLLPWGNGASYMNNTYSILTVNDQTYQVNNAYKFSFNLLNISYTYSF